ncbi:MAG: DUF4011 domain-containing protein [Thermomicrobium sp.]|nr:DUF4011 domain-containing protein [Thermomicrobium sp.]
MRATAGAQTNRDPRQWLEERAKRLLDLTARNPLLHSQPRLEPRAPSPQAIWQELVKGEERLLILAAPPAQNTQPAPAAAVGPETPLTENELPALRATGGTSREPALTVPLDQVELERRLTQLRRKARSAYDDAGFWTLFMAFGALEWTPSTEAGKRFLSPLVLVPVSIERQRPGQPFSLRWRDDEEMQANQALRVYLEEVEKLRLDGFEPSDESDLEDLLDTVEDLVRERGWVVHRRCWIGQFAFQKLAIYRDLRDNAERILAHPIVRAAAGYERPSYDNLHIDPRTFDTEPVQEVATVLPCDSSQLQAVLKARAGQTFVIQGPPGTGKSQTIVNIIADQLARGKTVLFVSEKRAALEVVERRLQHVGLGPYCLNLHSHEAHRGEVLQSIVNELSPSQQTQGRGSSELVRQLERHRDRLRDYTGTLHAPRPPLGRTPFSVIGRVLRLPDVGISARIDLDPRTLTEQLLDRLRTQAQRLAADIDLLREGERFPWASARRELTERELAARAQEARAAFEAWVEELGQASQALGLRPPIDLRSAADCMQLLRRFATAEAFDPALTSQKDVSRWLAWVQEAASALDSLERFPRDELPEFGPRFFLPEPPDLPSTVAAALADRAQMLVQVLAPRSPTIGREELFALASDTADLRGAWHDLVEAAHRLSRALGMQPPATYRELRGVILAARCLEAGVAVPHEWRRPAQREGLERLGSLVEALRQEQALRRRIVKQWDERLLEHPIGDLARPWLRWQPQRFLRWLIPSYRRARALFRRHYRGPASFEERATVLAEQLVELHGLRQAIDRLREDPVLEPLLALLPADVAANPETVDTLAQAAIAMQDRAVDPQWQRVLVGVQPLSAEIREAASSLVSAWRELCLAEEQRNIALLAPCPDHAPVHPETLPESVLLLQDFARWWQTEADRLPERLSIERVPILLGKATDLYAVRERYARAARTASDHWQAIPPASAAAWRTLEENLSLWQAFGAWYDTADVPQPLRDAAIDPHRRPDPAPLEQRGHRFHQAITQLAAVFADSALPFANRKFPSAFARPSEWSSPSVLPALPLADLRALLDSLVERAQDIRRFRLAADAARDLTEHLSESVVSNLVERRELAPESIPDVVERLVLTRWLEWVADGHELLAHFEHSLHEAQRQHFVALDERLEVWQAQHVIDSLNRRRARLDGGDRAVALLKREATKRRRHKSLRTIFRDCFDVILAVKPCWLMSPLSVSHFLQPHHQFDLVIMDEASQILPEDAIPALYRARQAIVCGDSKQLPPTRFFESTILDLDEPDEEEVSDSDPGESILETLEVRYPSVWLLWHYRSKDERLIAFSNAAFYDTRLITIPTPVDPALPTGIAFRFVGGIYDRSGRRTNAAEVEEVCRLISEHLERWGTGRSLGVVTMNEPQMHAILDELERRSVLDQQFQMLWDASSWPNGEEFFVKNLEAVQGDERDVIIVSTVYGRDARGSFSLQLGPLTRAGGERRLNVLVTRAREQLVLVTSLQPEDFRLTDEERQVGLRVFRDYLRYARDGVLPAAPQSSVGGPFESDFEASVADVIRSWGYDVRPQFGVGRYRIDLAIPDPRDPTRIRVAVECDGATYHRLPTVRERDRLRQQWLERNGWTVIRVWSTDWWYRRRAAEEKLRQALEHAFGATIVSCPESEAAS